MSQRLVLAVAPRVVWALVWLAGLTWRFEAIAEEGVTPLLEGNGAGAEIFCFWHQCVLPCTFYYRRTGATILISRSFDGELITRILELFGFHAVRGSSSRGAREGLLGQTTGARIGAFHLEPERAWTMGSWDRFLIPKPFTRIVVSWARWMRVPKDLAEEEFELKREELNAAIERARLRALAHFGKPAI